MTTSTQNAKNAADYKYLHLWDQYKADPTNATIRNELAMKYMAWIYKLAVYFYKSRNNRFPVEELVSVGFLRVLDLMKSFRTDGGCCFAAYSKMAILQALQKFTSHKQNGAYAKYAELCRVRQVQSDRLGRRANDHELAAAMGMSEDQLMKRQRYASRAQSGRLTTSHTQSVSVDAVDVGWLMDVRETVGNALDVLPPRYRIIVERHYGHGESLKDIGQDLGVSKQAVGSQIERMQPKLLSLLDKLALSDAA